MLTKVKKMSALLLSLTTVFFVSTISVSAIVSSFSGNIDGSEPQSFEVDDSMCTIVEPLLHYYETYPAYVTVSGSYAYTDLSISYDLDMQLTIFTDSYDPGNVLTNCVTRFDDGGTVSLVAGQQYIFVVQPLFHDSFNTGDWEFQLDGPGQVIFGTVPTSTMRSVIPLDSRINDLDAGASVAIYAVNGGFHVYSIDSNSDGTLALVITPEDIAAVPNPPDTNTLIAQSADGSIRFYRLTSGEFQLMAPSAGGEKTYVVIFEEGSDSYTSYES